MLTWNLALFFIEKETDLFLEKNVRKGQAIFLGFVGLYGSFGFLTLLQS